MNLPIPDSKKYSEAFPYPNCFIDDIFPEHELADLLKVWPKKHEGLMQYTDQKLKAYTHSESLMDKKISDFIKINFQSQGFIEFLEQLTGIKGLLPDFREVGLHETFPTGKLNPHLDYIINRTTGLQHRVNVLLYLNGKWKPEYKGDLELWDRKPNKPDAKCKLISPIFNRMAIFNIDMNAWHGHSVPLSCPEGMSRKSIALNYFTLPQSKITDYGTVFTNPTGSRIKKFVKQFIPPILLAR